MKDYSRSVEERKMFILSYEIKDNQIFLNLVDDSKPHPPIPYTEENEKMVIQKMEKQAEEVPRFLAEGDKSSLIWILSTCIILLPLSVFANIALLFKFVIIIIDLIAIVATSKGIANSISLAKDIEKSKFFLANKAKINTDLVDSKALQNVSEKAATEIARIQKSGKQITINDVGSPEITLKDLQQLKAYVEEQMFWDSFEQPADMEQGHQKSYGTRE